MRKLIAAALVVALAGVLAASALAAGRTVKVGDKYFVKKGSKPTVTVKRNTTVVFKWVGKLPHNVHVYKGPRKFKSTTKTSGTYTRKLSVRGTYKLVCDVHPADMRMTIRVK